MIISHRHRFIFVKTHKTAGSSLEVALARECDEHDIVSHMEDNIGDGIPRNYGPDSLIGPAYNGSKFVRKIVDRHSPLLGAFYYEHMPATRIRELVGDEVWNSYFTFCFERNPWDKVVSYYLWKLHGQGRSMPSFADYIDKKPHRLPRDAQLYFDGDAVMVDRVFEFRELTGALAELRERLNLELPEPLPREKTGVAKERKHYSEYYDERSKARIEDLFSREIAYMDYQFNA
ncbi:sulfotransferase family 2 domain-containing protein [Congregibacter variabilis]|uniref:Sulfotransferase family 2 domain-containing protein n=1 Tax=Congregibacter variabilis TaxID=3081200 RepID=A0ABZ0I608_9GAMM|nr:sulfotransferase family 2 domain-containing protein [Congregibacter sp. IMCC43200]